jgi:hypothetical protein
MNRKLLAAIFVFLCLATGCATLMSPKGEVNATPVITQSFASREIRIGDTWKIYLKASDPNGEMTKISAIVDQPEQINPESITKISKENGKEFSGYFYLPTAPWANILDGTSITLWVQIEDRSGNLSQPAAFPLTLKSLATQQPPPQGVFQERDLGPMVTRKSSWIDSISETLSPSNPGSGTNRNPGTGTETRRPGRRMVEMGE